MPTSHRQPVTSRNAARQGQRSEHRSGPGSQPGAFRRPAVLTDGTDASRDTARNVRVTPPGSWLSMPVSMPVSPPASRRPKRQSRCPSRRPRHAARNASRDAGRHADRNDLRTGGVMPSGKTDRDGGRDAASRRPGRPSRRGTFRGRVERGLAGGRGTTRRRLGRAGNVTGRDVFVTGWL